MSANKLTYQEAVLLQRHRDGEVEAAERVEARRLLDGSEPARIWDSALAEVELATRAAVQEIEAQVTQWTQAEAIAEAAHKARPLVERGLVELMPLLERFHDGELDEVELEAVAALLEEREDAADYLAGLDEVRLGMSVVGRDVADAFDSGSFWSRLESRLDEEAPEKASNVVSLGAVRKQRERFVAEDHLVMVYRRYDGEVSEAERAQVDGWAAEEGGEVAQTLAAMAELTLAVRVAVERVQERAQAGRIWEGVQAALEREAAEADAGVIRLHQVRGAKAKHQGLFMAHRREIVAAAVAALVTIIGLGVFGDKLFKGETVVVRERTVVIIDSVESVAGASVMVSGPMTVQPPADAATSSQDGASPAEAEPTVIWLLDGASGHAKEERNPI
jgi:hypothetical protein